jgi:hypothetical protein
MKQISDKVCFSLNAYQQNEGSLLLLIKMNPQWKEKKIFEMLTRILKEENHIEMEPYLVSWTKNVALCFKFESEWVIQMSQRSVKP